MQQGILTCCPRVLSSCTWPGAWARAVVVLGANSLCGITIVLNDLRPIVSFVAISHAATPIAAGCAGCHVRKVVNTARACRLSGAPLATAWLNRRCCNDVSHEAHTLCVRAMRYAVCCFLAGRCYVSFALLCDARRCFASLGCAFWCVALSFHHRNNNEPLQSKANKSCHL